MGSTMKQGEESKSVDDTAGMEVTDTVATPQDGRTTENEERTERQDQEDAAFMETIEQRRRPVMNMMNNREANERILSSDDAVSPSADGRSSPASSLSNAAHYLQTIQNQHQHATATISADGDETTNEGRGTNYSNNNDKLLEDLAAVDPVERVIHVAEVFREAATLGNQDQQYERSSTTSNSTRTVEEPAATAPTTGEDVEQGPTMAEATTRHNISPFSSFPKTAQRAMKNAYHSCTSEWDLLNEFLMRADHKANAGQTLFYFVFVACLPILATSALLFYVLENPPTGKCRDDECNGTASVSWWLIFLGIRQFATCILGRIMDVCLIDYIILQHSWVVRLLGARVTLLAAQSKGWPSVLFWWAIWDLILLYGDGEFYEHWLYWQDNIKMFTSENPGGNITSSTEYRNLIIVAVVVSICVSLKRYYVGLHLGARLCDRYNERLKECMKSIGLISELAIWARRKRETKATFERKKLFTGMTKVHPRTEESTETAAVRSSSQFSQTRSAISHMSNDVGGKGRRRSEDRSDRSPSFEFSNYSDFLAPWEEPSTKRRGRDLSGKQIIAFQQALTMVTQPYFFSSAYGPVRSREESMRSGEMLFRRLRKLMGDSDADSIDTCDLTRWMYKGCLRPDEQQKAADLMDMLLPDREGRVSLEAFLSGIDAVYRNVRLLQNAVQNHSDVDKSYEKVLNFVFYFVLGCIVLAIVGVNPVVFIASAATLLVSFAFAIGPAVSAQVEGILMILVRQPYDIGDFVSIHGVDHQQPIDGSPPWQISSIDLYTTTAVYVPTNETATFSNGSLARCRIINLQRSPEGIIHMHLRFKLDTPYEKILQVRKAVEQYIEDHPQEWVKLLLWRCVLVANQQNYVEYTFVIQHRAVWQNLGDILYSRGLVTSFAVECQKELDCYYEAPPMNVQVTMQEAKDKIISSPKSTQDLVGLANKKIA